MSEKIRKMMMRRRKKKSRYDMNNNSGTCTIRGKRERKIITLNVIHSQSLFLSLFPLDLLLILKKKLLSLSKPAYIFVVASITLNGEVRAKVIVYRVKENFLHSLFPFSIFPTSLPLIPLFAW